MKKNIPLVWLGYVLSLVMLSLSVVMPFLIWIYPDAFMSKGAVFHFYDYLPETQWTIQLKIMGFAIELIPNAIIVACCFTMVLFFRCLNDRDIFSNRSISVFRRISWLLIVWFLVQCLSQLALTALVTWHNPPGHRYMALSCDGTDLILVCVAINLLILSHVFSEGHRIKHENEQIV